MLFLDVQTINLSKNQKTTINFIFCCCFLFKFFVCVCLSLYFKIKNNNNKPLNVTRLGKLQQFY